MVSVHLYWAESACVGDIVQDRVSPGAAGDIILRYVVFFSYFCILFYQYQKEQER
jgi:hypothetical protein